MASIERSVGTTVQGCRGVPGFVIDRWRFGSVECGVGGKGEIENFVGCGGVGKAGGTGIYGGRGFDGIFR